MRTTDLSQLRQLSLSLFTLDTTKQFFYDI